MAINSRVYSVGWSKPRRSRAPLVGKRLAFDWQTRINETGLPSLPGRTARLKAINLLQIAAEVEHALMVQYLYAAYSLDEAFEQGKSRNTAIVDGWKRDIREVARQEMAHFVTVQNLLISLGAEVYVNRENNFSEHPDAYPFPVCFEPFGLHSLVRYVATESPAPEQIPDAKTRRQLRRILRFADENTRTKVSRVGILYGALYWLLMKSDKSKGSWKAPPALEELMRKSGLSGVHVKDSDFVSGVEYEEFHADPNEWEVFDDSMRVGDVSPRFRALQAIRWIMLQGEGPEGQQCNSTESHFCRFLKIYDELTTNPELAKAARAVPVNPVTLNTHRSEPVHQGAQAITHHESSRWAALFNVRYQMLLLDVLLALSTSRRCDPDLRKDLTSWAAGNEMEFLKRIGQLLPTMPRDATGTDLRAGAPFETVAFPVDSTKRWDQLRVLMTGSAQLVRELKKMISLPDERFSLLQKIQEFDDGRKKRVQDQCKVVQEKYAWKSGANQRIAKSS